MTMTCERARELLGPWAGGDPDDDEVGVLMNHLDLCAACRAAADGESSLREVLESPRPSLADGFWNDYTAEVLARRGQAGPPMCLEVVESLPLFVGDDLDPAPAEGVALHLADCDRCARELASYRRARASLRPERPSLPEGFWADWQVTPTVARTPALARPGWLRRVESALAASLLLAATAIGVALLRAPATPSALIAGRATEALPRPAVVRTPTPRPAQRSFALDSTVLTGSRMAGMLESARLTGAGGGRRFPIEQAEVPPRDDQDRYSF